MANLIDADFQLDRLTVNKDILSEDEKELLRLCLTKVRRVVLYHPVRIDRWKPTHQIKFLCIFICDTFVSKNEFKDFVPWIRLTEELILYLHDDTDFIDSICEWLRGSTFKRLSIKYRGKYSRNIVALKKLM